MRIPIHSIQHSSIIAPFDAILPISGVAFDCRLHNAERLARNFKKGNKICLTGAVVHLFEFLICKNS
jgi:hypothetical protein